MQQKGPGGAPGKQGFGTGPKFYGSGSGSGSDLPVPVPAPVPVPKPVPGDFENSRKTEKIRLLQKKFYMCLVLSCNSHLQRTDVVFPIAPLLV